MESISGITLSELQERIRSAVSGSFPDRLWVRCEINAVTESFPSAVFGGITGDGTAQSITSSRM